jgi:hypothetical protein
MSERQSIEWLGMLFLVPCEWEIVRHSLNTKAGSLILVDRRRQRLQLSWTECEKIPGESIIFSDFKSRDLVENPECEISCIQEFGRFKGYLRCSGTDVLVRAGTYDAKFKRWIDVAVPCFDEADKTIALQILESYASVRSDDKYTRLRAFRLDIASPSQWKLASADVKPAMVTIRYEMKDASVEVARIGATDTWFDGNLESFLSGRISDASGSYMVKTRGLHEACVFSGRERQFSLRWFVKGRNVRTDVAWHCPESHAVFHVMTNGSRRMNLSPDAFLVNCCHTGKKG